MNNNRSGSWGYNGSTAYTTGSDAEATRLKSSVFVLLIICLVTVVIVVFAAVYMSYKTSRDLTRDKVSAATEQAMVQAGNGIDLLLAKYDNNLWHLILDRYFWEVADAVHKGIAGDFERFEAYRFIQTELTSLMLRDEHIRSVHLFMENGVDISTSSTSAPDPRESDWYKRVKAANGQAVWIPVERDGLVTKGSSTFGVSRMITTPNRSSGPFGVLLVELDYRVLEQQLNSIVDGDDSYVLLVADEHIAYAADASRLGQPLAVHVSALSGTGSGRGEGRDHNGHPALFAYSTSQLSGWTVIGSVPVRTAVEGTGRIMGNALVLLMFVAIFAVCVGWFAARRLFGKSAAGTSRSYIGR